MSLSSCAFDLGFFIAFKRLGLIGNSNEGVVTMNYEQVAKQIIDHVGGEENVKSLVHCATRLRFSLIDHSKADKEQLLKTDGVIAVKENGGQFQVVIGNRVPEVYAAIGKISTILDDTTSTKKGGDTGNSGNFVSRLIDVVASIFTPLLGVMAGAGILKGLLAIATNVGWLDSGETTYIILHAASDSMFYFLPILLAVTAARKFETNPFVAATIAGALIYPSIVELHDSAIDVTFFGIPVVLMNYTSTVFPILLAVFAMSYVEKFCNKKIHEAVKNFVTPLILLVVIVPVTLIILGPIGVYLGNGIASVIQEIFTFSPVLAGAIVAGIWQVLVIFGIHWEIIPIILNNLSVRGEDVIKAVAAPAVFSQAGAALGVMLRTKNKKLKALAGSTSITALFGITEPAVYGVTLPLKKPFIMAVISAAVGGAIVGHYGSVAVAPGAPGLLTIPIFYPEDGRGFVAFVIAIIISFVLAAVLTYIVGFKDPVDDEDTLSNESGSENEVKREDDKKEPSASEEIKSPLKGEVVPLTEVQDHVFSSGAMGKGVAVRPKEGRLVAPINGTVTSLFETKHAIGITSDNGTEIFIHVGIDTVQLKGEHFTSFIEQGDEVAAGDVLLEFDVERITAAGYDVITPVLITNAKQFSNVQTTDKREVTSEDLLIHVIK